MAQQQAQGGKGCKARGSRKAHCLAYQNRSEGGIDVRDKDKRHIYWSPLVRRIGRVLRSSGPAAAADYVEQYDATHGMVVDGKRLGGTKAFSALKDIAKQRTPQGEPTYAAESAAEAVRLAS